MEICSLADVDIYVDEEIRITERFGDGVIVNNNPVNWLDPWGLACEKDGETRTFTWPYSWKGWVGVLAGGAGGVMIVSGVGAPVGWGLVGVGAAFATWDLVEGVNQAEDFAEDVVENIIEPHYEDLDELDRELEELGIDSGKYGNIKQGKKDNRKIYGKDNRSQIPRN